MSAAELLDEKARLAALHALGILDTPSEPEFDALVRAAASACGVPIALINLIDEDRHWFKANLGFEAVSQTPRENSFCEHTVLGEALFEVDDAQADDRFSSNPLVTGSPGIRFYAGAPLTLSNGARVGTLCVIDSQPKTLNNGQRETLLRLGELAVALIERRKADHRTVAALVSNLEPLSQVSRFTAHAVVITDALGRITWVNEGFIRITGYASAEAVGWKPGALLQCPETDQATVRQIGEALSRREGCRVDILNVRKNGERYWTDLEIQPLLSGDGALDGYIALQSDVTERKAADQTLRQRERLLSRIGAVAGVGGWELEIRESRLAWTDVTQRLHGVSGDYVPDVGSAIEFYAPEARPLIRKALEDAVRDGSPWDMELPMLRADGSPFWARVVGAAEQENGEVVRLVGAFQDVTETRAKRVALEEAQQRLALAIESGRIGVWSFDGETLFAKWDEVIFAQYGMASRDSSMSYDEWKAKLHPNDVDRVVAQFREALAGQHKTGVEYRVVWPNGAVRHLRSAVQVLAYEAGSAARLVGVNWDVTDQRTVELALRRERELLQVTLQSIADAVLTTDADAHVTWMNPVAERLTGWTLAEAQGLPLSYIFRLVHEDSRERADDPVRLCIDEQRTVGCSGPLLLLSRDGSEHGIEDSAAPIRDADDSIIGVVLVFRDVSEQRRLSREMRFRATHDALTQLFNREELELRLGVMFDEARTGQKTHSLMYIDLDQFKIVNDTCGHAAGDQLLQQVARLLVGTIRASDVLARLGGDEFAVLMEHCTPEQAERVAQAVCDQLDVFRFEHDGHRFRIGASIGVAPIDAQFSSAAAVLGAADSACLAAKEAGRNRVFLWQDSDSEMHMRREETQWATRIERALDEGQFELYHQRIEALGASRGLHAEILLRLRDDDGAVLLPARFMPAAERFHLAPRIDRWVLEHTLSSMLAMDGQAGLDLVCVNLSGRSVGDRAFHRRAVTLLEGAGPAVCAKLCLEITETSAVTNMADAIVFVERVRALGVRVALDDFGAGASSFGYLKALKVDLVKIDGQFIRGLLTDPLDEAAVRSFIEVARVLGVKTVAEFVDRPEVLARLRELGVDYAQGFLLHRPEPWSNALEELRSKV